MTAPVPRSRILDLTSQPTATWTVVSGPSCTPTVTSFGGCRVGTYLEMQDMVVPNYKERSNRGEIFNNAMSRKKFTFSKTSSGFGHRSVSTPPLTPCESSGVSTDFLRQRLGPLPLTSPGTTFVTESLKTAAATAALSNVKSPSVQGLAFAGEIQQTLSLLRNPFQAMTKLLSQAANQRALPAHGYAGNKAARKRWNNNSSKAAVRQAGTAVSSQYLAYSFGMIPLMHDIEGLCEALVKAVSERETARGSVKDSSTIISNGNILDSGFINGVYRKTTVQQVEVRAGALYAFSGRSLVDSLGVSLKDIPAAAWELLPWSFVIDWFSNVGQLIEAVVASCSNEFLAQWITVKETVSVTRLVTSCTTTSPWIVTQGCSDTDSCIYETYTRIPSNLALSMGLTFNFTLNRVPTLSALSLLTQQLLRIRL